MLFNFILILIIIFISVFTIYSGIYGAPSVPTPKKASKNMVSLMKPEKGRIYYDLGSGDGRILREVAKSGALAIGFEYSPVTYLFSKLIFLIKPAKNVKVLWQNFYKANLKNTSGVFCFLTPKAMERLEKKFKAELTKDAKVITYAFKLPNKKPEKVFKEKNYAPIYIYKY